MLPRIHRLRRVVPVLAASALALGCTTATASAARADLPVPFAPSARVQVGEADWGLDSHAASAIYPRVDGAPSAWRSGIDGRGVRVAVIDTGIDDSGDLAGKVVDGFDFSGEGDYTKDSYGHGTFVAGTIAGSGAASGGAIKGVAPGADLVSVKVAGADGKTTVAQVVAGIAWVITKAQTDHIRVLNLSLGAFPNQSWAIDPLNAAVEAAWSAGLVVVVSGGNSGADGIATPANDPFVITVGATDDATTLTRGDDTVAPFSSTGPTADGYAKPDLVAPGSHLVSVRAPRSTVDNANPQARVLTGYFRGSGTSFSAPQVAGAAALLLQQRPYLGNDYVKGMLVRSAVPLPDVAVTAQGAGALDIAGLLAAAPGRPANAGLKSWSGAGTLTLSPALLQTLARTGSWDAVAMLVRTGSWDAVATLVRTGSWDAIVTLVRTGSWDAVEALVRTGSWDAIEALVRTGSWDSFQALVRTGSWDAIATLVRTGSWDAVSTLVRTGSWDAIATLVRTGSWDAVSTLVRTGSWDAVSTLVRTGSWDSVATLVRTGSWDSATWDGVATSSLRTGSWDANAWGTDSWA